MTLRPLALALALAACAARSPSPSPSPPPSPSPSLASSCASCHADITAEWRSSFHRVAFTDDTFQRSLALEAPKERAFCTGCHAPAASRDGVESGVDCLSCHAAPHTKPPSIANASASATCATCHEFPFDDGRPELVQKTVTEHAASPFAEVSCTQCHMPSRDGHKDHRFLSGHAPSELARSVHVMVTRARRGSVAIDAIDVTIQVDAGHAFPTGDMFRRARLVVFAEGADGRIVGDAERVFGRTWGAMKGGPTSGRRTQLTDTRIQGRWREAIALDDPPAPIATVRWSLVYERVVAMRGEHVSTASSDELASGELVFR